MKSITVILVAITSIFIFPNIHAQEGNSSKTGRFDTDKDLLLAHYDCKTDVDDLQSVAALVTLLSDGKFSNIHYHAVAGAYGMQDGLYVPPNELFNLAFGDKWSDAHADRTKAIGRVKMLARATLENQGDIWIAEAGQSDFSAQLIKAVKADLPDMDISQRIHIVQHSDWNEEVTSPDCLEYVKTNTDYQKIPDGNAVGNGSPGFRSPGYRDWKDKIRNPKLIEIWHLAIELSNRYNGKDGRYLNEAISAGGLDFSDTSELCWILGLEDIRDTEHFFELFSD
jgi:predicted metal-dependent enzyme (double-stranded beta helix superfamily)